MTGHMPSDLLVQNAKYSWDITATKCVISSLDQVTVGVVHDDPLSRRCPSDGDEFDLFRRVERNQRAAAPTAITAVATSIHRPIEMLPLVGGGANQSSRVFAFKPGSTYHRGKPKGLAARACCRASSAGRAGACPSLDHLIGAGAAASDAGEQQHRSKGDIGNQVGRRGTTAMGLNV